MTNTKNMTRGTWNEFKRVLAKYGIPYTTQLRRRDVPKSMGEPDVVVVDKHVTINIIVPDYYEEDT